MAALLIFLFVLIVGYWIVSIQTVPTNMVWVVTLFGKRFDIGIPEGFTILPRWLFGRIALSRLEHRIDVLTKPRGYAKPDDTAPTHDQPHQSYETIMVPDGNGEGAVFVHLSNVSIQYRLMKVKSQWPEGWLKFMGIFGWRRAGAILDYTSIAPEEIEERIIAAVLDIIRQVLPNYPYQLIVRLNVKMDGKLVEPAERERIRREIDARILEETNTYLAQWGMEATRVPKGDIDPDPRIIQALQDLSAASLDRERTIIDMSAVVTKVNMMFEATQTTPTHEQWMQAYMMEVGLANQGRAADHGLIASQFFQQLKGVLNPNVTVNLPPNPPSPPPPPTTPTPEPVAA